MQVITGGGRQAPERGGVCAGGLGQCAGGSYHARELLRGGHLARGEAHRGQHTIGAAAHPHQVLASA